MIQMWLSEEIREEANRLASLDASQLRVEAIGLALRIGRNSSEASDRMAALDKEALNEFTRRPESASSSFGLFDEE